MKCTMTKHARSEKLCPKCLAYFCLECSSKTNILDNNHIEPDYMLCPHCGHDWYKLIKPKLTIPSKCSCGCITFWFYGKTRRCTSCQNQYLLKVK